MKVHNSILTAFCGMIFAVILVIFFLHNQYSHIVIVSYILKYIFSKFFIDFRINFLILLIYQSLSSLNDSIVIWITHFNLINRHPEILSNSSRNDFNHFR